MDRELKLLYEEEWKLELKRRAAELDSGAVKAIPWSEVKAHLRSLLSKDGDEKPRQS